MFNELLEEAINILIETDEIKDMFEFKSVQDLYEDIEEEINKNRKFKKITFENILQLLGDFDKIVFKDFYDDEKYADLSQIVFQLDLALRRFDVAISFADRNIKLYTFYVLFLLYLSFGYNTISSIKTQNIELFESNIKAQLLNYKNKNRQIFWYRGVSDCSYDLIPSMYRSLPKGKHVIIDNKKITELYQQNNLSSEYGKIFPSQSTDKDEFFAYMQHSIAFSPLLDFSNNICVATSFALAYNNPTEFNNVDSGLYLLVRNENKYKGRTPFNIDVFTRKLRIDDTIHGKPLIYCTIEDFYVNYTVIDKASNDRMRYQQGVLLKIFKAVFVNGKLLFPQSSSLLIKTKIQCVRNSGIDYKSKILSNLVKKQPYYSIEYLMNPYLWFSKKHK